MTITLDKKKLFLVLGVMTAGLLGFVLVGAVSALTGGPDASGYTFSDSTETVGPTYDFEDISTTGTAVPLSDNQVSGAVPIGFTFNYYEQDYADLYIGSNGFLTVLPSQLNGCCSGQALPDSSSPNGTIAGWWTDLCPASGCSNGIGSIHYETLGTAPNRRFIVQFTNVPYCCSGPATVTMQYKLFEGRNIIEMHYELISMHQAGRVHSVGIENQDGSAGLQYHLGRGSGGITNQFAVQFAPHHVEAAITSVDESVCPLFAEMEISDSERHDLSGTVNIYQGSNVFSNGLSEITLELLRTRCGGFSPSLQFYYGDHTGTLIDSVPQGPAICSCSVPLESHTYTNPSVLALYDAAPGATNAFHVHRSGTGHISWARVRLSGPGAPDQTYCAFDVNGGNCDVLNMCDAGFVTNQTVDGDAISENPAVLVLSEPYSNSTLPSSLDLTGLSAGVYNLELTASDGVDIAIDQNDLNLGGVCTALTINNSPPVCTGAVADPASIWPPNDKMVSVNVTSVTDGDGDEVSITIDSIRQDELVVSKGDKKLLPDGSGVGTGMAEVRAERYGSKKNPGNGRVYHIGFTADDGRGGTCTGEVLVGVPHDHKKNNPAVDDGALYDSTVAIPAGAE